MSAHSNDRLAVAKTYKLFIGGKFPRTESGRSLAVQHSDGSTFAHLCHGSRKDIRNAVEAARRAFNGWAGATAYLRGQILYRMAEMAEGKRAELASSLAATGTVDETEATHEVHASIDRLVAWAGWTDKLEQVLGARNPVAGPYYNFTAPEPTGVVGVAAPDQPALLGLASLVAPAIACGNSVVAVASETNPIPAMVLSEAIATSDLPGGVVNVITGPRAELATPLADHRGVDAIDAAGIDDDTRAALRAGAADNMKRVTVRELPEIDGQPDFTDPSCTAPWWAEPLLEMKTVWHPSAT
ncbi:MAG: aldehyde dehydrogenase family protein [Planctomycetota bacterium]